MLVLACSASLLGLLCAVGSSARRRSWSELAWCLVPLLGFVVVWSTRFWWPGAPRLAHVLPAGLIPLAAGINAWRYRGWVRMGSGVGVAGCVLGLVMARRLFGA